MKKPANELTALEAARAIEAGSLSSEALVRACLDRITERHAQVLAFTAFDPELALAAARRADSAPGGLLRGIPFAVKDIIDTADYVTAYGSPIYAGHRPRADAGCVALARERGAVVLGKVATSEFATQSPSTTRNPCNPGHTPGGSSSGSAAAVADCMVPVAFGTQTTASIVRPASYCGVVGYKPTFGFIGTAGVKPLSPTQDTVGVLARTVADAAFFAFGLHGARAVSQPDLRPRLAVCHSRQWDALRPEMAQAIEQVAVAAERLGASPSRHASRWRTSGCITAINSAPACRPGWTAASASPRPTTSPCASAPPRRGTRCVTCSTVSMHCSTRPRKARRMPGWSIRARPSSAPCGACCTCPAWRCRSPPDLRACRWGHR